MRDSVPCTISIWPFQYIAGRPFSNSHQLEVVSYSLFPVGPVTVDASATSEKEVENELSWVLPGGHWAAPNCPHQDSVAILVPFRLRENHLAVWLRHMHPFLRKQNIDYTIFVVEQTGLYFAMQM